MEKFIAYLESKAHNHNDVFVRDIVFELRGPDASVLAHNDGRGAVITLYMGAIGDEARANGEPLAIETARALAHEFRHLDQLQAWDELPQVGVQAGEKSLGKPGWSAVYWHDPGEDDARQWASEVVENMPEDVLNSFTTFVRELCAAKTREEVERKATS